MPPAVVAVPMKRLGAALASLEPESRALLDLSLRRGFPDDEIAQVRHMAVQEVGPRRDEALERLAAELELTRREERDELFATLQDLPDEHWQAERAQAERA